MENMEMINASDLVQNPDMKIEGKYRTLYDKRGQIRGFNRFKYFEAALNIMAEHGWVPRMMAISDYHGDICVIMKKIPSDKER